MGRVGEAFQSNVPSLVVAGWGIGVGEWPNRKPAKASLAEVDE